MRKKIKAEEAPKVAPATFEELALKNGRVLFVESLETDGGKPDER